MRLLTNLAKQNIEFDFQSLMSRFMFSLFLQIAFHEYKLGLDVMSDDPASLKTMPEYVSAMDEALHCECLRFRVKAIADEPSV